MNDNLIYLDFGTFSIYWYGIFLSAAVLTATLMFCGLRKLQKESFSQALNVSLFALPAALLFGRLFYCWFGKSSFSGWSDCVSLTNGGYGLYGALAGMAAVILIFCRIRRQSALSMLDAFVPPVAFVIAAGRFASISSGDDIGFDVAASASHKLPFIIWSASEQSWILWVGFFEGLAAVCIFLFTFALFLMKYGFRVKGIGQGSCMLLFMLTYGLSQAMLESMRNDSLFMVTLGFVRISQIISIVMGVTAVVIVAVKSIRLQKPDRTRIILWLMCIVALGIAVYCEFEMNTAVMVLHYSMMGLSLAFIMGATIYLFFRNVSLCADSVTGAASALPSPPSRRQPAAHRRPAPRSSAGFAMSPRFSDNAAMPDRGNERSRRDPYLFDSGWQDDFDDDGNAPSGSGFDDAFDNDWDNRKNQNGFDNDWDSDWGSGFDDDF